MTGTWPSPLHFGPWLLGRRLAVSAMSEVWLGQREGDRTLCVVKRVLPILREEPVIRALFQNELQVMARLDHPGVPRFLASGEARGVPWLAMPHYPGVGLQTLLAEGPLPSDAARWLVAQVALALSFVHGIGVVHADVAPDNLHICADGRVLLLDFGIAVLRGTRAPMRRGKAQYASPEQLAGEPLTEQTDLSALRKILAELRVDDVPTAEDAAALAQGLSARVADPRAAQAELAMRVSSVPPTVAAAPWRAAELIGEDVTDPAVDAEATTASR